jgi:S-adenosylmethionine:tRNA-ribosyltransferase-isomerase (queuine synthetase)
VKKYLIMLLLLLTATCIYAELVTSTLDGGVISTLPKVGQTVKKGDMLVTFDQTAINAEIDTSKIEINIAKELLKTKDLDKKRANKLVGKGMSGDQWEECMYDAVNAKLVLEKKEADLSKLEFDKTLRFIPAPCDCKVTKVYIIENSGTYIGQRILQVERLN